MSYKKKTFFKKILNFFGISLILSLLFLQVFQLNDLVKTLYLISNQKEKLDQLSEENKVLKLEFSQNGSLKNLEDLAAKLNFEKVKKIKYIQITEDSFVIK